MVRYRNEYCPVLGWSAGRLWASARPGVFLGSARDEWGGVLLGARGLTGFFEVTL